MRKFNTKTNKYEDFDYRIGQIVKYKCHNKEIHSLFLENINNDEITVILIDSRLNEGIKVNINKNQII